MIDLHSRMLVGWSMHAPYPSQLGHGCPADGLLRRKPSPGLMVHSDRGSQYCGHEFQSALRDYGM
jgi:putative transposase